VERRRHQPEGRRHLAERPGRQRLGRPGAGLRPGRRRGRLHHHRPGLLPQRDAGLLGQIAAFKSADAEILLGVPIPPDFTTFWQQAKQQGYTPKIATVGKALLFPSSVEALGDIGNNLGTEVWWTPTHPFTSSLTGQSAQELADAFEDETDKQWTQPLGFVHALFEVMSAALEEAGSTEGADVTKALASLQVDTVVGPVEWGTGPVANVAKTPLVGGQWRQTDGSEHPFELVVVSNSEAPEIPTAGTGRAAAMSAALPLLEVRSVNKRYGSLTVVKDLSFEVGCR
jgi:branched-chain amino acid transport system substrate-binding protein